MSDRARDITTCNLMDALNWSSTKNVKLQEENERLFNFITRMQEVATDKRYYTIESLCREALKGGG